jgi:hypothetical protein
MLVTERSTYDNWPRCLVRPLTIISARLVGMPYIGSAAAVIHNHLYTYLKGNLVVADFEFQLGSNHGIAVLEANLNKIVTELDGGSLQRYCFYFSLRKFSDAGRHSFRKGRFLVVLTNHSSPDTGDLHIVPDSLGAAPLDKVSVMPIHIHVTS